MIGRILLEDEVNPSDAGRTPISASDEQAEHGLSRSAEFIERVLQSAPCILAIYDVNTLACRFVNDSVAGLLGYSHDDVLVMGDRFFETVFSPDDYAAFRDLNARMAAGLEGEILRCAVFAPSPRRRGPAIRYQDRDHTGVSHQTALRCSARRHTRWRRVAGFRSGSRRRRGVMTATARRAL